MYAFQFPLHRTGIIKIIKKTPAASLDITRRDLWFEGLVYIVYDMTRYDAIRYDTLYGDILR